MLEKPAGLRWNDPTGAAHLVFPLWLADQVTEADIMTFPVSYTSSYHSQEAKVRPTGKFQDFLIGSPR